MAHSCFFIGSFSFPPRARDECPWPFDLSPQISHSPPLFKVFGKKVDDIGERDGHTLKLYAWDNFFLLPFSTRIFPLFFPQTVLAVGETSNSAVILIFRLRRDVFATPRSHFQLTLTPKRGRSSRLCGNVAPGHAREE